MVGPRHAESNGQARCSDERLARKAAGNGLHAKSTDITSYHVISCLVMPRT